MLATATLASCVTTDRQPKLEVWVDPRTEVQVYDQNGVPTAGTSVDPVLGLGTAAGPVVEWNALELPAGIAGDRTAVTPADAAGQDPQDPAEDADAQEAERRRREALIRTTFGDSVLIGPDGRVTKQYFLSGESGPVFKRLLAPFDQPTAAPAPGSKVGGQVVNSVLGQMLGADHEVEIVYLENFEAVVNMPVPAKNQPQAKPQKDPTQNSLLLATALPDGLLAFERALDLFYTNIPQIEIEVKVVEFGTDDALSVGIQQISDTTPTLNNLSSGKLINDITADFPLTAPFLGGIDDFGSFTLGGIHDNWELSAVLQLLERNGVADVLSQPKMVVRNGGLASIQTITELPFPKARISNNTNVSSDIQFKDVGITMDIRPEIAGTDTVILQIYASVSAVTSFADTEPVPTPIVATRQAATSVHLKAGQTTVIGGLVSKTVFDNESKIPILGDIPILGYLFRSTATQETRTELAFQITPRIITGSRGHRPVGLTDG